MQGAPRPLRGQGCCYQADLYWEAPSGLNAATQVPGSIRSYLTLQMPQHDTAQGTGKSTTAYTPVPKR